MTRRGGNFGQVSVKYLTFAGTATEGVDYVTPSGELVFDDGVRDRLINITIQEDSQMEYEETFNVQLVSTTGTVLNLSSPLPLSG